MSEFLTVRLSSEQLTPIQWLVWSDDQQEIIASGELANEQDIEQLAVYAQQRITTLLLSANDTLLTQVAIPAGGARQLETMLPYLVEDDVAQDVEEMHFSILHKTAANALVCGVDRAWLTHVLALFNDVGITVKQVMPDVLALPQPQAGQVNAVLCGEQWLLRHERYSGVSIDNAWLDAFCHSDWFEGLSQPEGENEPLQVTCFSPLPNEGALLASGVPWQCNPVALPMSLLAEHARASSVNLLTGPFKAKSSWIKHWLMWRKVAVAAAIMLAVFVAQQFILVSQYEQQAQAYRTESERIFRQVFPNKRRIPTVSYLKRQMTSEQARLSGGSSDSVLDWLALLPPTLTRVKGIQINSIKYDGNRDEVRLQATSTEFQTFEQARVKLAEHFAVEQGPLNRNGKEVSGDFTLKRL